MPLHALHERLALIRPSAMRLGDVIQFAGVEAFRSDDTASPGDLIVAHVYALALAIAAVDAVDGAVPLDASQTVDAAVSCLRATVQHARELARRDRTCH
jgi:hypothetical protein